MSSSSVNDGLDDTEVKYAVTCSKKKLVVVSQITIIVATELTIQWNQITDVYTLQTAGQTIPLIVGGGLMLRVFWKAWWRDEAVESRSHLARQPRSIEDMATVERIHRTMMKR